MTHGKAVRIAKSFLCKIIGRKDIISKNQFQAPVIYRQVLKFGDKFYGFYLSPATNSSSEKNLFKKFGVKEL